MSLVTKALGERLAAHGLDITHPFDVRWYNDLIKEQQLPLVPLPSFGREDGQALGILVGNSAALWLPFLRWLGAQPNPDSIPDPLDTFTSTIINQELDVLVQQEMKKGNGANCTVARDVFWAALGEPQERLVSMQRVAVVSGVCYHDSETQLAIHPTFGSWLGFRAVIVLDIDPNLGPPPARVPCLLSEAEKTAAREAMAAAMRASDAANLCTQLHGAAGMEKDVRLAWAALRDCVSVGKEHRYSEAQLVYHYTKDRTVLNQAVQNAVAS